jgi:hypothetical protein
MSGNHIHNNLLLCGTRYTVNVIRFDSVPADGQIRPGQTDQLSWALICNDPACVDRLNGPGVPTAFNPATTTTYAVSSSIVPTSGATYTLSVAAGGATVSRSKTISVVQSPPPPTRLSTYYFMMTDPTSDVLACFICIQSATSEAQAQASCQAQATNYQIQQVTASTQCPPPF